MDRSLYTSDPARRIQEQVRVACCLGAVLFSLHFGVESARGNSIDVLTHHYDNFRTGWNAKETELTPAKIRMGSFGPLFAPVVVDELVDAQPLIATSVSVGGRAIDLVYIVTENNTVYTIDSADGTIVKKQSLGPPVSTGRGKTIDCGNNGPVIGITGTPVIDRASNTLYVISFTEESGEPVYRIHALDLGTLADKVPSRVISASAKVTDNSIYNFNPRYSRQRSALTFSKGNVYAAFGSFCDSNWSKSRGWLLGWKGDTLEPLVAGELTDRRAHTANDRFLASIWMSGSGAAIDDDGSLFVITGNSAKIESTPVVDPATNLQESIIRIDQSLDRTLDYFTPSDVQNLDTGDNDFGSGGIMLIPGQYGKMNQSLGIAAGKKGTMFLFDRNNLGHYSPSGNANILATVDIGQCWCAQSFFVGADNVGRVLSSGGDSLTAWKLTPDQATELTWGWAADMTLGSDVFQKGFFTSISSADTKQDTAIVWAVQRPTTSKPKTLSLWAFDAKDGTSLVKGIPAGNWPYPLAGANIVPVVANGRVYVASDKALMIFGLGAPSAAQTSTLTEHVNTPSSGTVFGTVVALDGSLLWLRTKTRMVRVDIGQATTNQKVVTLIPGRAVAVNGSPESGGAFQAEMIEYAPDSPAMWPEDN